MIKNLKNARSNKDCPYCKTDICIRHMKFEKPKKEKIKLLSYDPDTEALRYDMFFKINEVINYINKHED